MHLDLGNYHLDIDAEKTRRCYEGERILTSGCGCDGCRNFEKAADCFPEKVRGFFDVLGIDIKKACEVYVNCSEDNGSQIFYGGFYYLCGTVTKGDSAWKIVSDDGSNMLAKWEWEQAFEIDKGYYVSFSNTDTALSDRFSGDIVIMDIEFHIPWVLEEKNGYS